MHTCIWIIKKILYVGISVLARVTCNSYLHTNCYSRRQFDDCSVHQIYSLPRMKKETYPAKTNIYKFFLLSQRHNSIIINHYLTKTKNLTQIFENYNKWIRRKWKILKLMLTWSFLLYHQCYRYCFTNKLLSVW